MGADDGIGPGGHLAEELLERQIHGVGQDEGPREECDAERDRRGGQDKAELVREHPAQGEAQHGAQAPRCFMWSRTSMAVAACSSSTTCPSARKTTRSA